MNGIHSTAIIEEGAQIDASATIGPFCIIGPHVVIEKDVHLKAHVVVEGRTRIGEGTIIFPFASIGQVPQDLKYDSEPSELIIGKNNTIREYVTMHIGTKDGDMKTIVGDGNLIMIGVHVAHDVRIGNNTIIANNVALAGHVEVGDRAFIGGLSGIHQFVRIGTHAVVGFMSAVENDVIPYGRVKGERAHLAGLNLVLLERQGFSKDEIRALQRAFNQMFGDEGTLEQRLESVEQDFAENKHVKTILDFAREESKFPLCQPKKKSQ